ncbi:thioredoxin family protein [Ancylomarina longa]|uniref:Thioredoxin family protein n=1 Tax=Ancylomarina longa TaxID=2487017 RepID=A0A434AUR4_9BACT|nr:thioredoxin family protein [Ancylomarina longa]RUT78200.1 thioredoxin family protein [Ancylomarina longa]
MKKYTQMLFLILTISMIGFTNINAQNNLPDALKKAKLENKQVLINFSGSDWCRSCILLRKTILSTNEFKDFAANNLVILNADFPRLKKNKLPKEQVEINEKLAAKYNPKGQFPTVILMDSDGKVLGRTGYKKLNPSEYVRHIQSIINN